MDRETAQRLRDEIVQFGTRAHRHAMTSAQKEEYERARRSSRDAARHINDVREMAGRALGGIENLSDNHEIDDGDARVLARAQDAVQRIACELGGSAS